MAFIVLVIEVIYIILAIFFVRLIAKQVRKDDPKRLKKIIMAVLFFVLLPTWDVLLAYAIQFPCCWFWGGEKVIEPIKTDSLYYNIGAKKTEIFQWAYKEYFRQNIEYIEIDVSELVELSKVPKTGLFRFWVNDTGKVEFAEIEKIESRYEITDNIYRPPVVPLSLHERKIIDRKDGSTKAYYRAVSVGGLGVMVPFFTWLKWYDLRYAQKCPCDVENIIHNTINVGE